MTDLICPICRTEHDIDPLAGARGIAFAAVLSMVFWVLVVVTVAEIAR